MDHCLSNLLNSNRAPREEEIDQILNICSESAHDLKLLNEQILRLQASLQLITARRDDIQAKLDVYRIVLSPLRRCPTEILQQIFFWTIDPFPVLSSSEGPLLLGRVCSRWRSISASTPELWSAIHVTVPEALHTYQDFNTKCDKLRGGLSTWLERAGVLPLYISVFSRNENTYQEDVSHVASMLKTFVPYSKQWAYLSIQVPASTLKVFSDLRGDDVPLLESAFIGCSDPNPFVLENNARHPPFLETAPSLRRLNLGDAGPLFRPNAPWSQLQFLALDHNDWNFGPHDLMGILGECSQLQEIMLTIHARTDMPRAVNDPISLPYLKKLSVNTNSIVMVEVLEQLCLPKLHDLHLGGYRAELTSAVSASLKGMLHRSRCDLESLKLDVKRSSSLTTSAFVDLLKMTPSLKVLSFQDGTKQIPIMDEELLRAFADTVDVVCPRLEVLYLPDRFTYSEQALEQFITLRLDPPPELTKLHLAIIVSFRSGLAKRFARFGDHVKVVEDIPYRNLPSAGRPSSRFLEYSDS